MMRTLAVAVICLAMGTPALACRGTAQFPEAAAALAAAELPEETKATLKQRLAEAEALHARGHEIGNGVMMGKALVVLDEIKARLSQ